jgi:DNA-binding GntR family transcriptional regulator
MVATITASEGRQLKPLRHESLVELAYRAIRESIVTGRFPMGARLVEAHLAADLGVSRGPVREALRRLREEQLVFEVPRQGTFVREFGAKDIVDIYNLRLPVEAAAIRLATRRRTSTKRLSRLIEQMAAAAADGKIGRVVDAELAFHEEICAASGNEYIATVFQTVSAQVRMALSIDNAAYSDLGEVATEHEILAECIESGDEAKAEYAIRAHIVSTIGDTIRRLGGNPDDLLEPLPQMSPKA